MTYYELLGVPPGASPIEIHGAYRRAIRRYHPDVNKAPDALRLTMMFNEAWGTLGDPAARAAYDRRIGLGVPTARPTAQRRPSAAYARRPQTHVYERAYEQAYERPRYEHQYNRAPYEATVAPAPSFEAPISRMISGGLRALLLVAFVASVIHWFPLVAAVCVGVFVARAAGRACR
jgi:curved DNA-binding protein CbpA